MIRRNLRFSLSTPIGGRDLPKSISVSSGIMRLGGSSSVASRRLNQHHGFLVSPRDYEGFRGLSHVRGESIW